MMKKAVILAAAVACGSVAFAQSVVDSNLRVTAVAPAGSFYQPAQIAFLSANDMLVTQKWSGRVQRITNGVVDPQPVLDLVVANDNERGLWGLALDPQFGLAGHNYVYLSYVHSGVDGGADLDYRISRFEWNGTALINEQILLSMGPSAAPAHYGGIIKFGPPSAAPADQKLFVVLGDRDQSGQNENISTGPEPDYKGIYLRLNPDGSTPVGAEKGPFYDVAGSNVALQRTYAYGFRNSFGFDFDPLTQALWGTENGPESYDEINRIDAGANGGWRRVVGPEVTYTGTGINDLVSYGNPSVGTYTSPKFSWLQPLGLTALHFQRSTALGEEYQNDCFVACFRGGKLYKFEMNPDRDAFVLSGTIADKVFDATTDSDSDIVFGSGFGIVTDVKEGPDGNLYVVGYDKGAIWKISHKPTAAQDDWQLYQ